jgi:hypothetical protein
MRCMAVKDFSSFPVIDGHTRRFAACRGLAQTTLRLTKEAQDIECVLPVELVSIDRTGVYWQRPCIDSAKQDDRVFWRI